MKVSSLFICCLMLAIFVVMLVIAWGYPEGARFQPFVIGIPALALCVLQLVLDLYQSKGETASVGGNEFARAEAEVAKATGREVHFDVAHEQPPVVEEKLSEEGELGREIVVWSFIIAFIAGVIAFGFWISIPIFLFLFLTTQGKVSIPKALLMSAIGSAAFYTMFEIVLRVKVHEGFLRPWLFEQLQPLITLLGLPIKL